MSKPVGAPGAPAPDPSAPGAATGTGRSFWKDNFPNLLRAGGVVLGALLAGSGRKGGGAVAAALTGAVILGFAVHAGLKLVERGVIRDDGLHPDRFNKDDLVPSFSRIRDRFRGVMDHLSRVASNVYEAFNDGIPRTAHIDTEDEVTSAFAEPFTVPTSGVIAQGRLRGFERAAFTDSTIGTLEVQTAADGQRRLVVEWSTLSREGETYDATFTLKKGDREQAVAVRLTRPMMGPLGDQLEHQLARQFVHDEIAHQLRPLAASAEAGSPDRVGALLLDTARQLELAGALLDPHHPDRKGILDEASELRRLAETDFTRLEAVAAIERAIAVPWTDGAGKLTGDRADEEVRVLNRVGHHELFRELDSAAGSTKRAVTRESTSAALERIRDWAGQGHPIHRLASKMLSSPDDAERIVTAMKRTLTQRREHVELTSAASPMPAETPAAENAS